jgi:ElaB/YqjD/DUF883 family membrane-anchored ribosome-binding protein
MDRVRSGAAAQLSSQKERATDSLGSLARAVRGTSQPLRENQQDTLAQYVEKAADRIERFSTSLRERDVKELVDEAQQFARRQPAIFIGVAFAAGVIAARFLKSSSDAGTRGYRAGERHDRLVGRRGSGSREGSGGMQTQYSTGGL